MFLDYYKIRIPLKFSIDHNLKSRTQSESLICVITDEEGLQGFGEGAPRPYVTGEDLDHSIKEFRDLLKDHKLPKINSVSNIQAFTKELLHSYNSPSSVCAIEMALLDLLGKKKKKPISKLIGHDTCPIIYSGVLPQLPKKDFHKWVYKIKEKCLPHVKIKVGHDEDLEMVKFARQILGDEIHIRLDANRAWSLEEALIKVPEFMAFGIEFIEEPLISSDTEYLSTLCNQTNIGVILDESIFTLEHASYYVAHIPKEKLIFNLKLSKCGGMLNTKRIFQFAQSKGVECQLGCNVGESIILTAAGRQFAQSHPVKYLEGAYSSIIMKDDLGQTVLDFEQFGYAPRLEGNGLSINIDSNKIRQYQISSDYAQMQLKF